MYVLIAVRENSFRLFISITKKLVFTSLKTILSIIVNIITFILIID